MEERELRRYLNLICRDIDGAPGQITIACFPVEHVDDCIELAFAIAKYNGSVNVEFEEI